MNDATGASRLSLLVVAPEYPPATGGMETHAKETARRLEARGHRVTVLTRSGQGAAPAGCVAAEPILDRRFGVALRRIERRARETSAQVILLMNAAYAPIAGRLGASGPPVVARTVGNDVYGAWHGPRLPLRFLFWRLPHGDPGSFGARLRRLDQERRVGAVVAGLGRCEAILCNSRYVLERLRGLGLPAASLRLLVGGVDPDAFRPDDARPPGAPIVLGTAGRLKPIKGFATALEALATLARRGRRGRLIVAGTGPDEAVLRERSRSLGLDASVEFLGDLNASAMPGFFRRLDLYLQPSIEIRHESSGVAQAESMGRALLEAQASGVPVIASRTGGIPDVVEHERTGLLVPPGDAEHLAEAIERLAADAETRRRLAAAARQRVLERFSWDAVVRETEAAIEAALGARRDGRPGAEADRVSLRG